MEELWLIWSNEHLAYWKPARCGYTTLLEEAGRYTFTEAKEIVEDANKHCINEPNEAMLPDSV